MDPFRGPSKLMITIPDNWILLTVLLIQYTKWGESLYWEKEGLLIYF